MSRLIVPSHALGRTSEEQQISTARQAQVVSLSFIMPGSDQVFTANLGQPVPIEGLVGTLVGVAFKAIEEKRANEVADRIVPSNGHMN